MWDWQEKVNTSMRFNRYSVSSKLPILGLLYALFQPCLSLAQTPQQSRLTVAPPEQLAVKRGTMATETLKVTIAPGYHVNSDKPKDEFLIPLKLTWTGEALQPVSFKYPAPEEIKVGADSLVVFTGNFNIETEFKVPQNAATGAATVTGKLRYQACNTTMCFRPASVDVVLPVVVQ